MMRIHPRITQNSKKLITKFSCIFHPDRILLQHGFCIKILEGELDGESKASSFPTEENEGAASSVGEVCVEEWAFQCQGNLVPDEGLPIRCDHRPIQGLRWEEASGDCCRRHLCGDADRHVARLHPSRLHRRPLHCGVGHEGSGGGTGEIQEPVEGRFILI